MDTGTNRNDDDDFDTGDMDTGDMDTGDMDTGDTNVNEGDTANTTEGVSVRLPG